MRERHIYLDKTATHDIEVIGIIGEMVYPLWLMSSNKKVQIIRDLHTKDAHVSRCSIYIEHLVVMLLVWVQFDRNILTISLLKKVDNNYCGISAYPLILSVWPSSDTHIRAHHYWITS